MNNENISDWTPVKAQLMTRWSKNISSETPLPEYPRPQLKREKWLNLNGLWDYTITRKKITAVDQVKEYTGKILVPFPIESGLSGVCTKLGPKDRLWYRRFFTIPETWNEQKILLNFGAVDWEATIWVNNAKIGTHKGGYTPFTFDITNYLTQSEENELVVSILDPTDKGQQEKGKQFLKPKIVFYTAVSGIWQTVWMEPVSEHYIRKINLTPDVDEETLNISIDAGSFDNLSVKVKVIDEKKEIISVEGPANSIDILKLPSPNLWSPESPFLYNLTIDLLFEGKIVDSIGSYFGMRKIETVMDEAGNPRIALNNKPLFQYGLLDQGYWPDGLYTAPTDEALKYDIEITKELGFNLIRKHVKVESARWYYHCDKIGILVWQDMPNGGNFSFLFYQYLTQGRRKKSVRDSYYQELNAMIQCLYNSPSIIVWVPFNEGWGQFETEKVVDTIKQLDSSRLIDAASGWFDKKVGHIKDIHKYPGPKIPEIEKTRVAVLGEFGGLGYIKKEHTWVPNKIFGLIRYYHGFRKSKSEDDFFQKYSELLTQLKPLISQGLCAAIYTQTTDIEGEINGLLTYDRDIIKIEPDKLKKLHSKLFNQG